MAGSQLKNLKKTLKEQGFTGQTNVRGSKKGNKRQAREYDREERAEQITRIREQFSPFELKVNRDKRAVQGSQKAAQRPVGKPGISKQVGEQQRLQAHEARSRNKNKLGGVLDRRFGERNKDMTQEDKMLERFTRERQSQSSTKKSLFNLEDDDDEGGFGGSAADDDLYGGSLTHYGKSLALEDDFEDGDLGLQDFKRDAPFDSTQELDQPARKKTKAEVMKEVIAKSKFYKQERQKTQEKLQDDIQDVDQDFDDIMSELNAVPKRSKQFAAQEKSNTDREYDTKVRELGLDKRAAPADRTKTQEEIEKENTEKRQKLEQARLDRMNGMFNQDEDRGVEDLGDDFWGGDDSQDEGEYDEHLDNDTNPEDDLELPGESNEKGWSRTSRAVPVLSCPQNQEELSAYLEHHDANEHPSLIKDIVKTFQPQLAAGNKEKLGNFVGVLLRHILSVSNSYDKSNLSEFSDMQNALIAILKSMAQKYNEPLSLACREIINELQARFKSQRSHGLSASDLVFFTLVGYIFSTSDHYHLVVTPCNVLIGELLEQTKLNTYQNIAFCAILARISLSYQRVGKRLVPELVYFFEKSLMTLLPMSVEAKAKKGLTKIKCDSEDLKAPLSIAANAMEKCQLNLRQVSSHNGQFDDLEITALLCNILSSLDDAISKIWKEVSAFPELTLPFATILMEYETLYPEFPMPRAILDKIKRLQSFNEHFPLALQNHRPLSIPTHTPKYEENFNPDKKSYDPDRTRNEVNKMKAQIKKDRKFTMKEIRKDTRFEARQQIDEKKKENADYHSKMARLVNQISTEEGAEKGKYEREKRLRGSKR
ncbi:LANO_0E01706g1_1 [Lachancea nothofagi CBS 11611]|uniref:LANO_0E01706g1_1 n=1 Tax=Lachancea nothofagi CBS 11611 TaxID=1266666 RepID=A0A1G4JPJ3_9SACH|nr:LANO_0E01706g1_1 [Lachancea nothofagi CBS 11611]